MHSTWNNDPNNLHINAIFFENYWNSGSPVTQERYFDNIVISSKELVCDCNTTDVLAQFSNIEIHVFPNPVNDILTISGISKISSVNYFIRNLFGTEVSSGKLNYNSNTINVSVLSEGMYFLLFEGKLLKFIKQ